MRHRLALALYSLSNRLAALSCAVDGHQLAGDHYGDQICRCGEVFIPYTVHGDDWDDWEVAE